jgi:hypothetical protein
MKRQPVAMRSLAWLAWTGVVRDGDANGWPGDTADGGCAPEVDSDPRLACIANGDDAGRLLSQGMSLPERRPQAPPAPQGA